MQDRFDNNYLLGLGKEAIQYDTIDDYSQLLNAYGADYFPSEYYWQVGEIQQVQGWILHLSVVKRQLADLLNVVIPELMRQGIAFKIVRDRFTADRLLEGNLGYVNLAKIICAYPLNNQEATVLARKLIELTKLFNGPAIPTDLHLGGAVYTRYGSFSPLLLNDPNGQPVKYIYDHSGELIPDPYVIPFSLPSGIEWPFHELTGPAVPPSSKLLNFSYYAFKILKSDAKGDVLKANYFRRPWQIKSCLIKQGKPFMFSDGAGRDIRDRLQWQRQLYRELAEDIPIPEIFDYFEQNGSYYLAMEFIKGIPASKWIDLLYQGRRWHDLPLPIRRRILEQLLKILAIVQRLHERGYIHRDITPENFLIDKKDRIFLIDMELSWSSHSGLPDPPFQLGTPGFISPEQNAAQTPTIQEDIFAIGAFMLVFVTNLSPVKFIHFSPELLESKLFFFTGGTAFSNLIPACLQVDRDKRPSLVAIQDVLRDNLQQLDESYKTRNQSSNESVIYAEVTPELLNKSLCGLTNPGLLSPKNRWLSRMRKKDEQIENMQLELTFYQGWHTGMAGPLWLVAMANSCGLVINSCQTAYDQSWDYIERNYFKDPAKEPQGLYSGGAGIALALAEGWSAGLIPLDPVALQQRFANLFLRPADELNLSSGLAGQGLALLRCLAIERNPQLEDLLKYCVQRCVDSQLKDGSWNLSVGSRQNILVGMDSGVAGVIWFLLAYIKYYSDSQAKATAIKGLQWLLKSTQKRENTYSWPAGSKSRLLNTWDCGKGTLGIVLLLIRAYEVLNTPLFREIAEGILTNLPARPVRMDLTLGSGLAGLGEIYLEAFDKFNHPEWEKRADWIAQLFTSICYSNTEEYGINWIVNSMDIVTADLFSGNSGIIHFLIRYSMRGKLQHPLSPDWNKK